MTIVSRRAGAAYIHDIVMAAISFWLSFYLRVGDDIAHYSHELIWTYDIVFAATAAAVFYASGLYRGIWRYASVPDLIALARAVTLVVLIYFPLVFLITRLEALPRSIIGINWLVPRLTEFTSLYPEIRLALTLTDEELDLSMREADVALRTRKPTQPDLIQRKLFSIGFHAYCSPDYAKKFGTPRTLEELDNHRLIVLNAQNLPPHLQNRNWLIEAGRNGGGPREPFFKVNNVLGLVRACQQGIGIAALPDYLIDDANRLLQLFGEDDSIQLDAYFVYPEELKSVARVQVFRDFIVSKAQRWPS